MCGIIGYVGPRASQPLLLRGLDELELGDPVEDSARLGDDALTGPVSRGDAGTVRRHLAWLAATAPESVAPYLALARRTADRAIAAGRLRPADAESLLDVLSGTHREVAA